MNKCVLNGQIVLQLIGDGFIKDACQNFAEQSGNDKDQYDDQNGGREIDKQPACGDHCDKEGFR